MAYDIYQTDIAEYDLKEIFQYIALDNSIEVALKISNEIEAEINKLSDFPFLGGDPKSKEARKQKYRVLLVNGFNVYYKIFNEDLKIIVYRVRNAKMKPSNQI